MKEEQPVRLRAHKIGPRGGRKLVATRIVQWGDALTKRNDWEMKLGDGYEVTIQTASESGGPIRPRA